jgi:uncharacterized protein (TIGR00725 family)
VLIAPDGRTPTRGAAVVVSGQAVPVRAQVAVVGPGEATPAQEAAAVAVGRGLARLGAVVVTGGLGGVMAAASRGAAEAGGLVLGLLPGDDAAAANAWVDMAVPTGMGEARDALVVAAAQAVVVVGGSWGTLAEVALAARRGRPVVVVHAPGLDPWRVSASGGVTPPGPVEVASPEAAVARVAALLGQGSVPAGPGRGRGT